MTREADLARGPSDSKAARLLLTLVLALAVAISWRWMHANGFLVRPPATEGVAYRVAAARLLVVLEDEGPWSFLRTSYLEPGTHTPLLPMVGAVVGLVSGQALSPLGMWLAMMTLTIVFGLGTFWLARSFLSPLASVAVVAITLCCPVVAAYQRDFLTSLAMVCFLVWTFAALVRANLFGHLGYSLAFSAFAALATFGKIIAPVYFVGPALVAALLGLRKHGVVVLRNVALVLALFAAVIGPWFVRNALMLWDYSDGIVSPERVPLVERLLPTERLLYYPQWVINCGFGFALSVCILLAVIWTLTLRIRGRSKSAWILACVIPTSLYLITFVQTGGRSQYMLCWVPLGALLLVHTANELHGRARAVASVVVGLAALWTLGLAQRSVHDDENIVAWKGLHLIGGTGQYLSAIVRTMHLTSSPDPERWPVEEFTDIMLDDSAGRVPRLASSHPIITPNMAYEATMRRRAMFAPKLAIMEFAMGRIDAKIFAGIDYVVTDSMLMNEDAQMEGFAAAGIETKVLAERIVTSQSTVRLLALRHAGGEARRIHSAVLDEHAVAPTQVRFAGGLELHGTELVTNRRAGEGPALNLFFHVPEPVSTPTTIRLELRTDDRILWSGERIVPPLLRRDPRLVTVCFGDSRQIQGFEHVENAAYWVALSSEAQEARIEILATDLEVSDNVVRVAP